MTMRRENIHPPVQQIQAEDRLAALNKLANGKEQNLVGYTTEKMTKNPIYCINRFLYPVPK
jgi:hypothetical protein